MPGKTHHRGRSSSVRGKRVKGKGPPRKRRKAATTADVLGIGAGRVRYGIPQKWREQFERLMELREQLTQSQGALSRDAKEEQTQHSMHMADSATDHYDRDWALGMLSSEQNALYEIEQALNRMRNGTYGVCEMTGKRIEKGRLRALPWARFSVEAERKVEAEGYQKRAGLGQIRPVGLGMGLDEEGGEEEGKGEE